MTKLPGVREASRTSLHEQFDCPILHCDLQFSECFRSEVKPNNLKTHFPIWQNYPELVRAQGLVYMSDLTVQFCIVLCSSLSVLGWKLNQNTLKTHFKIWQNYLELVRPQGLVYTSDLSVQFCIVLFSYPSDLSRKANQNNHKTHFQISQNYPELMKPQGLVVYMSNLTVQFGIAFCSSLSVLGLKS